MAETLTNSNENSLEKLDQEFEKFFKDCEKRNLTQKEMQTILKPLKYIMWKNWIVKYVKIILMLSTICCLIYYIDFLNWHFCAIGRILMIKVLPIWDWTKLYNTKCLVDSPFKPVSKSTKKVGLTEYDCIVCENFENIDLVTNVSYTFLHEKYLIRALPVIITDSDTKSSNESWHESNFIDHLFKFDKIIYSDPCDLETNLVMNKLISFDEILKLLQKMKSNQIDYEENWFLHFRNCNFKAVKESRLIADTTYFYPRHLGPPYTSWLLLSNNYKSKGFIKLTMQGLIMVRQLEGSLTMILKGKDICDEYCGEHQITLLEGDTLIFLTDLWNFSYLPSKEKLDSITFVTETDFML